MIFIKNQRRNQWENHSFRTSTFNTLQMKTFPPQKTKVTSETSTISSQGYIFNTLVPSSLNPISTMNVIGEQYCKCIDKRFCVLMCKNDIVTSFYKNSKEFSL